MESDNTDNITGENDSLRPTTSPSGAQMTLIPLNPYLDTLSLLCVLMLLPEWLGCGVLISSILLGSSRLILGRSLSILFTNLMAKSHSNSNSSNNGLALSLISPVMASLLLDVLILFSLLLVQHQMISIIQITLYAVIASNLASFKTQAKVNSLLAGLTIIALQLLYGYALSSLDLSGYAMPGFTRSSLTINHIYYLKKSWRFSLKFLIEFTNALLSIHICILNSPVTKFFPFTTYATPIAEISSSLSQNSNHNGQSTSRTEHSVLPLHVPKDISESCCPSLFKSSDLEDIDGVPASYPLEQLSNIEDISSSSLVVTQNFENYCILPSSNKKVIKRKASVRFSQPLWSLLVAIKAMIVAPDAYSGEDKSNALVQYTKTSETKVLCSVFLTSETSIGLELIGCRPLDLDIVVRIDGVIWHQKDSARFKESTIYLKVSMLSKLTQYHIEVFYDLGDGELEFLTDIDVSTTSNNPTLQQPIRSSPLITLQQSLETTLENINKEKLNLKRLKKDHQKRVIGYKNDIASKKKKLDSDKDEKNHRRIMALRTAVSSLEQEYSKVNDEIMDFYSHETEVQERYLDSKREFDLNFRELAKVEKDYELEKAKYTNSIETLTNELVNLQNKNDRLSKKLAKIVEEATTIQNELKNMFVKDITKRQNLIETKKQEKNDLLNQLKLELSKLDKELELLVTDNDMLKKQANY